MEVNITPWPIGASDEGMVIMNGVSMTPHAARCLATTLHEHANKAEARIRERREAEERKRAAVIPVDHSARTLTDGSPVTEDHRELRADGQQKGYVVLTEQERAKGFVRPVRRTYKHLKCGSTTTMGLAIAETYAREPKFYNGTFCCNCGTHFDLNQFIWEGTDEQVGS